MDPNTDWLQRGRAWIDTPFDGRPEDATAIITGLVGEVSRQRDAAATPEGQAPVENRSLEWVDGIMTASRPSHIKAITNAMMRSATREGADYASQMVASSWAIAAALRHHPDPSAAVFAITVIIMSRMIKITEEEAAGHRPEPPQRLDA
jgi:hypothetical protein